MFTNRLSEAKVADPTDAYMAENSSKCYPSLPVFAFPPLTVTREGLKEAKEKSESNLHYTIRRLE
jgi:hypothetical protein